MNNSLSAYLIELVETLRELRVRFRQAARVEVARAVGEALRDFATATICGPSRHSTVGGSYYSGWQDPWRDPADDPWHAHDSYGSSPARDDASRRDLGMVPPALLAGFGAARWSYLRTRQFALAILIGLLVALGAYGGGPTLKALLEAWLAANDLLSHPTLNPRL